MTVVFETGQQLAYKRASTSEGIKPRWIAAGAAMYVPQQLSWILTLALMPMAIATPLLGASYVSVPFAGSLVFKEKITRKQWFGIVLIVCGIALVTREVSS